jgi:anthranilate synthase/aminodeoxychorismate synthase-like glutamine amidotransferase
MNLLLLDNHDSFTWNLVELLRTIGKVNVKICNPEILVMSDLVLYDRVIFSPGPGLPQEQPAMFEILKMMEDLHKRNGRKIPVLGVCLGMQAIAIHFGGSLVNLGVVVHGQPRKLKIHSSDHFLFCNIPDECDVGLYHSWAVDQESLPECLEPLAVTHDGTLMALAHKSLPVCGVQFHPESYMTAFGKRMIENWLNG